MGLQPLLDAPALVQAHALAATTALVMGAAVFLSAKGTPQHRLVGRIAAIALMITALSSFGIHPHGFSVIHLLSILSITSVTSGIVMIRRGNRHAHMRAMRGAWLGLAGAAIFTLLPGRVMNAVFFGH